MTIWLEELQALEEVRAAVKRGDMSRFISLEEFEKKRSAKNWELS